MLDPGSRRREQNNRSAMILTRQLRRQEFLLPWLPSKARMRREGGLYQGPAARTRSQLTAPSTARSASWLPYACHSSWSGHVRPSSMRGLFQLAPGLHSAGGVGFLWLGPAGAQQSSIGYRFPLFGPCAGAAVIDWVSVSFDPLVGPCAGTAVILWVCYSWQWL